MEQDESRVKSLTRILSGELFKALGFNPKGFLSKTLSPIVQRPIHCFSEIAVGFDTRVQISGFQAASQWILPNFANGMVVTGAEAIPRHGPLLIVSNHPGAHDTLVISSNLPRDDLKIIVNIPLDFIKELPSTLHHFLYAPPDPHIRMHIVRSAIQHLKDGGSLLLFAGGGIGPDPDSMPGTEQELERWSRSLEIFLRRVPSTHLLITIVSSILVPKFINHFLTRFRKERPDKQRISEFIQVMNQMLSPGKFAITPRISFAPPVVATEIFKTSSPSEILQSIVLQAKQLLADHIELGTYHSLG